MLESAKPGDAGLLPAASALASYDPDNARWESAGGKVAQALVSVSSIYLGDWLEYLTDVRSKLTAPLATIFRDRNRSEADRAQAIDILALYASDDLDLITNLLMDADPTKYGTAYDRFLPHRPAARGKDSTVPPGGDRQEGNDLTATRTQRW